MKKFKEFLEALKHSIYYKLMVCGFFIIISAIGINITESNSFWNNFFGYMHLAAWVFPVGYAIYALAYAWIINPIRSLLNKKKNNES